jgi:hypothetical protein
MPATSDYPHSPASMEREVPAPAPYPPIHEINAAVKSHGAWVEPLRYQLGKAVVGQKHLVECLLVGLLSGGHLLLEGCPAWPKPWR